MLVQNGGWMREEYIRDRVMVRKSDHKIPYLSVQTPRFSDVLKSFHTQKPMLKYLPKVLILCILIQDFAFDRLPPKK